MKTFALALSAGGARGLAAIAVLEVLDELGRKPAAIAGVSIGAALGAAYAAGMPAQTIRRFVIEVAHRRSQTVARLMQARATPFSKLFSGGLANPMLIDAEKLAATFLPRAVPEDFAALDIPLTVIATDLYGRSEVMFTTGPLRTALAASMAIPGLLRPVEIDGRVLIDGGAVNPLPFEHLRGKADVVIAIDNTVGPTAVRGIPQPLECLLATFQVMGHVIVAEKLKHGAPDLTLHQDMNLFRLLDFFQASSILRVAEAKKAEIKAKLVAVLGA
ncbi:MAG: patatin-like phospholipase family protein [Rhizobiales bacterium]|nr:patatin-like phospholipase family protein [Hyphomicrobiales bacterium]